MAIELAIKLRGDRSRARIDGEPTNGMPANGWHYERTTLDYA